MKHNIFLLHKILDPDFTQSLSVQEKQELNDYLHQMKVGPADGNMDGEWQTDGLGVL